MRRRSPHTEWLSLVEVSGPFLTLSVLDRAFPGGLETHDPAAYRHLQEAYAEWEETHSRPGIHRAWIGFLLQDVLGYPDECLLEGQAVPPGVAYEDPTHHERVQPALLIADPQEPGRPKLPVLVVPPGGSRALDAPLAGSRWPASPLARMQLLLQATGLQAGFVTNGAAWALVHVRKGEPTGYVTWQAALLAEEPIALQAFRSLLGVRRVYGQAAGETLFDLLDESAADQEEVTRELGRQVRHAVEVFLNALERLDRESGRKLLAGAAPKQVYDAALTVMMRLVFLLCAEQNGLLPQGDLYDRNYAVSTLNDQLREAARQHGEEVLEHRHDAWMRLLATFRLIHGGCAHEDLKLPAYGGSLFDPTRYPFLEGVEGHSLRIDNRVVLHLLDALEFLEMRVPGGTERRRLSFRALGVEEIGHVYEGLLDHTARRAETPTLGLIGKETEEPELPLAVLEQKAEGREALVAFLAESVGRSARAVHSLLDAEPDLHRVGQLTPACGGDEALAARVRPFLNLVRDDSLERLQVYPAGALFMTAGQDRRSTGTHYTPVTLTEEIIRHTLEPLVYTGPAEGKPRDEWALRSPRALLELKLCDPAMGSGAFLVQACRYLAERLVEAWDQEAFGGAGLPPGDSSPTHDGPAIGESCGDRGTPGGSPVATALAGSSTRDGQPPEAASARPLNPAETVRVVRVAPAAAPSVPHAAEMVLPDDPEERLAIARRLVADHCLYGVDRNPMAVEMAKLSLWLITLAKGKPFTFLDHRLKHGDSLVGCLWREGVAGTRLLPLPAEVPDAAFQARPGDDPAVARTIRNRNAERNLGQQSLLPAWTPAADAPSYRKLADLPDTPEGMQQRAREYYALRGKPEAVRQRRAADLWCAAWFWPLTRNEGHLAPTTDLYLAVMERGAEVPAEMAERVARLRERIPFFHWALEFPDVLAQGGFDAIVSNPPFQGGKLISGALGTDYREYLVQHLASNVKGHADLCAYFFLRASRLLRDGGGFGMLATNTIAQGDTREVGLEQLVGDGCVLPRAVPSRKWPGTANLEVAVVWIRRGAWNGERVLEEMPVPGITPFLTTPGTVQGKPYRLAANAGKSFIGSYVLGMGFVLTPDEAQALIEKDARNGDVLFPYLNGEDLNSRPDQSPSRWVINFRDWPLRRGAKGEWEEADDKERQAWLRSGIVPDDYPERVAADYPDCLAIVEERVKPERTRRKENAQFALRYPLFLKWWVYADKRPALYATIAGMERVLAGVLHTKYWSVTPCPGSLVFSHALVVFALPADSGLGILGSSIHEVWAREYSGSLETRLRYSPSDCFDTFPLPPGMPDLRAIAQHGYSHRQTAMRSREEGPTGIYNRFHNPAETAADIARLRELHVAMDQAVAAAYGWADLDLGHGFHETKQGVRFTIGEAARREVLGRLLKLNHERYAEEVAQGLHEKGRAKSAGKRSKKANAEEGGSRRSVRRDLFDTQLSLGEAVE